MGSRGHAPYFFPGSTSAPMWPEEFQICCTFGEYWKDHQAQGRVPSVWCCRDGFWQYDPLTVGKTVPCSTGISARLFGFLNRYVGVKRSNGCCQLCGVPSAKGRSEFSLHHRHECQKGACGGVEAAGAEAREAPWSRWGAPIWGVGGNDYNSVLK